MRLETEILTSAGGRQENQDAAGHEQKGDLHWFLVADGLGGHRGGATASALMLSKGREHFLSNPVMNPEALSAQLAAGHHAIVQVGEEDHKLASMRSTAVVLVSDCANALWAHAGDTRLYHFRNGKLLFQTKDHSVPQTLVMAGDIMPGDIRHHEDRNRLLRCLGKQGDFRPTLQTRPSALAHGDAFLLCTDGFWEYVLEVEMALDWAKSENPAQWLDYMECRLLRRASGEFDNYTAIAVFVHRRSSVHPALPLPSGGNS